MVASLWLVCLLGKIFLSIKFIAKLFIWKILLFLVNKQLLRWFSHWFFIFSGRVLCRWSQHFGCKSTSMAGHFIWRYCWIFGLNNRLLAWCNLTIFWIGHKRTSCRAPGTKSKTHLRHSLVGQSQCQFNIKHFNRPNYAIHCTQLLGCLTFLSIKKIPYCYFIN